MSAATYAGHEVEVDAGGYMTRAADWTEEIGAAIAAEQGLELTDEHWKVIRFAREDHAEQDRSPGLRRIAAGTGVSMRDLYRLFPKGPGKLVAKVAGLPKPTSCV